MHIYFSGIGGAGLSALAHLALDVGFSVSGSDIEESENTDQLKQRSVKVHIGQSGSEVKSTHNETAIDWVIITSALPKDHPEIQFAREQNIKVSKRDELINHIVKDKDLKLLAVSGTHGKTTVTGMAVWIFKHLNIPVSYAIGTNISYGRSAEFDPNSQWFVYEADEFDRNMLQFHPDVAVIPSLDFDHSDTYESVEDYQEAFKDFVAQSKALYTWRNVAEKLQPLPLRPLFTWSDGLEYADEARLFMAEGKILDDVVNPVVPRLYGEVNKRNGLLMAEALYDVLGMSELNDNEVQLYKKIINALEVFPGTGRRFEKLAENIFSDYAHHPEEIEAVIDITVDYMSSKGGNDLIVVYQPHQNIRQHEVKERYKTCFKGVDKLYWLPTYLSRENPDLSVLKPKQLTAYLSDGIDYSIVELNKNLMQKVKKHQKEGDVVLLLSAGSIDAFFREKLLS